MCSGSSSACKHHGSSDGCRRVRGRPIAQAQNTLDTYPQPLLYAPSRTQHCGSPFFMHSTPHPQTPPHLRRHPGRRCSCWNVVAKRHKGLDVQDGAAVHDVRARQRERAALHPHHLRHAEPDGTGPEGRRQRPAGALRGWVQKRCSNVGSHQTWQRHVAKQAAGRSPLHLWGERVANTPILPPSSRGTLHHGGNASAKHMPLCTAEADGRQTACSAARSPAGDGHGCRSAHAACLGMCGPAGRARPSAVDSLPPSAAAHGKARSPIGMHLHSVLA